MITPCMKDGCRGVATLKLSVDCGDQSVITYACHECAANIEGLAADLRARWPGVPVEVVAVNAAGVS